MPGQNGSITDVLAVGTADRNGRLIHNQDYKGGHFIITATTKAGATVTNVVTLEALVPGTTATFYTLLATTPISTGTVVLKIYPGLSTDANLRANDVLPEWFRVRTTSGTTGTLSLSVDANLVV